MDPLTLHVRTTLVSRTYASGAALVAPVPSLALTSAGPPGHCVDEQQLFLGEHLARPALALSLAERFAQRRDAARGEALEALHREVERHELDVRRRQEPEVLLGRELPRARDARSVWT